MSRVWALLLVLALIGPSVPVVAGDLDGGSPPGCC